MKIKVFIGLLVGVGLTFGCTSSKSSATAEELQKFERIFQNRSFEFEAEWAMPLTTNALNQISNAGLLPPGSNASRINLIGNANYLRVKGDSVSARLPYYGERQMGGGYGRQNVGIVFKGPAKDMNMVRDEKSNSNLLRFTINDDTENYQVAVRIFPNLSTNVNINSSQRLSISYQGYSEIVSNNK